MSTSTQPFRILLRLEIAEGRGEEFEQTWLSVGNVITDHPANRGQWLMRSAEEASVYYIISDWTDEPGFREFERSDEHVDHRVLLHPFRTGGYMTTMTVLHHLLPEGVSAP
jgi:heme-degrading monooxygenase HmoA